VSRTPRQRDPDLDEVFAELHRQDEEAERALGRPPSEKLPPIRMMEVPGEDESLEAFKARDAEAKRQFEAKYGVKEPTREESLQRFEDSLVRMRESLDRPSGSAALDAANKRVYAASMAMLESTKASLTGAPHDFMRTMALMRESHDAFDAGWLARLEHLRTTCAPDMRPKVDKAIAWQKEQIAETQRMNQESDRELEALRRLGEKS